MYFVYLSEGAHWACDLIQFLYLIGQLGSFLNDGIVGYSYS